jgi:hypothetical protein
MDRVKRLPTEYDVHEWEIMRDFADSLPTAKIREDLLDAIHGARAFRSFQERHPAAPDRIGLV